MRPLACVLLLVLTAIPVAVHGSQEASAALKPAPLELPDGNTAWAVRVIRTGGIAGSTLDIAVTSNGDVTCVQPANKTCSRTVDSSALQPVASIMTAKEMPKFKSAISKSCRDCLITRITIRRREADGRKVQTYFAYWDDTTAVKAPFDFVRLATQLISLSEPG
jgi:hypothetical protein